MFAIINRFQQRARASKQMQREDNKRVQEQIKRNTVKRRSLKETTKTARVSELALLDRSLSAIEKRTLRITWMRMQAQNGVGNMRLCERVFDKLMLMYPQLKQVFCKTQIVNILTAKKKNSQEKYLGRSISLEQEQDRSSSATLSDHARLLSQYLDFVISWLNEESEGIVYEKSPGICAKAKNIGRSHITLRAHQVTEKVWDDFADCLAEEIQSCEPVLSCVKGSRAWNILIVTLIDHMRMAFENQTKLMKHCSSDSSQLQVHSCLSPRPEPESPQIDRPGTSGSAFARSKTPGLVKSGSRPTKSREMQRNNKQSAMPLSKSFNLLAVSNRMKNQSSMKSISKSQSADDEDVEDRPVRIRSESINDFDQRRGSSWSGNATATTQPIHKIVTGAPLPVDTKQQEAIFDQMFQNSNAATVQN